MFQKLYKHLEEISHNTQQYQNTRLYTQELAGKISGQLEAINSSIRQQSQLRGRIQHMLLTTNILLALLGTVIVVTLVWRTLSVSAATKVALDRSAETSRLSGIAFTRYQEMEHRFQDMQDQASRLDSLIVEQDKTIKELQKLNKVTAQAFFQLKKDMDQRQTESLISR